MNASGEGHFCVRKKGAVTLITLAQTVSPEPPKPTWWARLRDAFTAAESDSDCEVLIVSGIERQSYTEDVSNDTIDCDNSGDEDELGPDQPLIATLADFRPLSIAIVEGGSELASDGLATAFDLVMGIETQRAGRARIRWVVSPTIAGKDKLAAYASRFKAHDAAILSLLDASAPATGSDANPFDW